MDAELPPTALGAEPSLLLVLLALLVAALALKVVLTSVSEGQRAPPGWRLLRALWPGLLAWGLGLWAAGLLSLVGLEAVNELRFSQGDALWLFGAAVLSGLPPLLWLSLRQVPVRAARRLGGAAVLLALPAMAMPWGWLRAARLDPAPLWLPAWAVLGAAVAVVGLSAALALAYNPLGQQRRVRRLSRTAAALGGGGALLLGQVLVHEAALVSDEAFSSASAAVPVDLMAGLGALTPMLLVGLMVLQRLRRYAHEDQRRPGPGAGRRRRGSRLRPAADGRRAAVGADSAAPTESETPDPSSLSPEAAQPRRRTRHQRHRVL